MHRRRYRWAVPAVLAALAAAGTAGTVVAQNAQTTNAKQAAQIGKPFQNFALRDIVSGKNLPLSSFKGKKIVVAAFVQNNCGTTWLYEKKIGDLIRDYKAKGVEVVAIHSSFTETDTEIRGQMDSRNLPIPILDDKKTQALRAYMGAVSTPTFFIIDKEGVLRYRGSFDSRPSGDSTPYVRQALDAIIDKRQIAVTQTRAFG
ncbi:MAG: redoxin domain-containing protein [Armatimonadaceae bacterium]